MAIGDRAERFRVYNETQRGFDEGRITWEQMIAMRGVDDVRGAMGADIRSKIANFAVAIALRGLPEDHRNPDVIAAVKAAAEFAIGARELTVEQIQGGHE